MKRFLVGLPAVILLVLLAGCGSPAGQQPAPAQQPADASFPQKDITLVVPYSPGGSSDTYARLLAPYIQKNLPGKASVVVKNVPGGESKVGLMEVYTAQPNGYTIGVFDVPGQATAQIMGTAQYDLRKVVWLGRISDTVRVMALAPKSPYKSLQDLQQAPLAKVGTVGLTSSAGLSTLIAAQELGIKINPIAHDSSQEAVMSAIRGDVDAVMFPFTALRKFIVDSKDLTPLITFAPQRLPDIPDTPTSAELGYPDLAGVVTSNWLLGATPGIPADVAKVLQEAVSRALADPEFLQMAANAKMPVNPAGAAATAELVEKTLRDYARFRDLISKYAAK